MRLVFMGTPEFSVPTLESLLQAGHEIVAVYSQPPSRSGRGKKLRPSPVHDCAQKHELDVFTPSSLRKQEHQEVFARHQADAAIVIAYGLILPQVILDMPEYGCFNLHASLLPRWRGAAPIQRAIMAGDTKTGMMVMQMEAGLDTGPVCLSEQIDISENTTAGELHDTLKQMGGPLMVQALQLLQQGKLEFIPQSEDNVTYAHKISKKESRIDWNVPAHEVHNRIRGLSPFPGSWFELERDGKMERIKVLRAQLAKDASQKAPAKTCLPGTTLDDKFTVACKQGAVILEQLQRAGKKPVSAADFLRGFPVPANSVLK